MLLNYQQQIEFAKFKKCKHYLPHLLAAAAAATTTTDAAAAAFCFCLTGLLFQLQRRTQRRTSVDCSTFLTGQISFPAAKLNSITALSTAW